MSKTLLFSFLGHGHVKPSLPMETVRSGNRFLRLVRDSARRAAYHLWRFPIRMMIYARWSEMPYSVAKSRARSPALWRR